MDFGFSPEEEILIREVRDFIRQEATPELLAETLGLGMIYGGKEGRKFIQKFAARGWLTPNWPREFGGLGANEMVTYLIREEMSYALVPTIFVAAHMAGPTLLRVGNEEQCEVVLNQVRVPRENLLGRVDQGGGILKKVLLKSAVGKCAEMSGGGQRVRVAGFP